MNHSAQTLENSVIKSDAHTMAKEPSDRLPGRSS